MISSGRLCHQVRIERRTATLDSSGEVQQDETTGQVFYDWEEVATVWAAIEPLSAREFSASQADQSQIVARIVMRYRDDVDGAVRLVHVRTGRPDVIYNPTGFLPDKESGLEYMTAPVTSGVNSG